MWIYRLLFAVAVVYTIMWSVWVSLITRPLLEDYSYIIFETATKFHVLSKAPSISIRTILVLTIWHIVFDWILLSIPVIVIFRLQMPTVRKLRCVVLLAVGRLSCIGASYALKLLHQTLANTSCKSFPPSSLPLVMFWLLFSDTNGPSRRRLLKILPMALSRSILRRHRYISYPFPRTLSPQCIRALQLLEKFIRRMGH